MIRPVAIVALLLLAGILPAVWSISSLAAALLTAPALLLVPTGLGLAATYGISGRRPADLTALQALLLAYFVGLFLFILLFVASERFLAEPLRPGVLTGGIWVVALAGWWRMRALLAVPGEAVRPLLIVAVIAGLLVAVRYATTIVIYSDFPVLDLFQRIQFHGGAWEFARNLTLNPFVASSYIPFQQLQLGLFLRLTGVDPLVAEWVWPLVMAPLQIGAFYAFFSGLLPQRRARILAFAVAFAQCGLSNPTNGTIAELASITVLSILLAGTRHDEMHAKAIALRLLALVIGIAIGLTLMKLPLAGAGLASFAMILLFGILMAGARYGLLAAITLLAAVALPFHRGALLFLVLGGATVAAYGYLVLVQQYGGEKVRSFLRGLLIAAMAVAAAMTVRILLLREGQPDAFGLWSFFDLLLMPLAGKSLSVVAVDGDLAPGAGSRIALFELVRAVSPLVVGVVTAYTALLSFPPFRRRWGFSRDEDEARALSLALLFFGLVIVILTGFPFIHRASFLAILLVSGAIAHIFLSTRFDAFASRLLAFALAAYGIVVVAAVYVVAPPGVQPYLERALPVFAVLGIALAAMPFIVRGRLKPWNWRNGAILVLVITAETAASNTYFKRYAFSSQIPPSSGALASFDERDLALARFVADRTNGAEILVSDPKMMAFLRARTGLYPFLASSNLGTVDVAASEELVSLLNTTISERPDPQLCGKLAAMLEAGNSAIYSYGAARHGMSPQSGESVLDALGYDNRMVPSYNGQLAAASNVAMGQRFLIIFDRTTMDWLGDPKDLRYFPVHGPLPSRVIANLDRTFPVHHVFQDTYIAELECK
ncbi:MAG: hypothetical protein WA950_07595 [Shinella sp.]|uniref:hypothetical protein n=1 Tax=Shinella sp. TaxID=1870904 RepID=UPI003C78EC9D